MLVASIQMGVTEGDKARAIDRTAEKVRQAKGGVISLSWQSSGTSDS